MRCAISGRSSESERERADMVFTELRKLFRMWEEVDEGPESCTHGWSAGAQVKNQSLKTGQIVWEMLALVHIVQLRDPGQPCAAVPTLALA
jgi:hypothetical protein